MAKSAQKVSLSPSLDITFDKLVLNQSRVRRIKSSISVQELDDDIARRGLLQNLNVGSILNDGVSRQVSSTSPLAVGAPKACLS